MDLQTLSPVNDYLTPEHEHDRNFARADDLGACRRLLKMGYSHVRLWRNTFEDGVDWHEYRENPFDPPCGPLAGERN